MCRSWFYSWDSELCAGESQIAEDEFSELKAKSLLKGKEGLIQTLPVLKKDRGNSAFAILLCRGKKRGKETLRMKKRLRGE